MKKRIILVVMLLMMVAAFSGVASAASVVLVNNIGVDIYHVYFSAASTDDWEEDILGRDVLSNGDSVNITYPGGNSNWDIMVQNKAGDGLYWENLNLRGVSRVTLRNDGTAVMQ